MSPLLPSSQGSGLRDDVQSLGRGTMIVNRRTFDVKPGCMQEAVELVREAQAALGEDGCRSQWMAEFDSQAAYFGGVGPNLFVEVVY